MPTGPQLIVWIIVGLLGGSLAGLIAKGARRGFGTLPNLGLGLAGALIGGLFFRLFDLFPQLDQISVSLRDVVSALLGSLLLLLVLRLWDRLRRSQQQSDR